MKAAKIIVSAAFAVFWAVGPVDAQTGRLKGNHIGCVTEDALDQMTQALVNQDRRLYDGLIGTLCVPVQGLEFSLLDRAGLLYMRSKVRVYVGQDHIDLWVPSEATPAPAVDIRKADEEAPKTERGPGQDDDLGGFGVFLWLMIWGVVVILVAAAFGGRRNRSDVSDAPRPDVKRRPFIDYNYKSPFHPDNAPRDSGRRKRKPKFW